MATEDARKLFMAGLPDSVTEEVLRGLFQETGAQVTELTLPRDRITGRPRGFAFVRLNSEPEADRARQDLDGRIVDGKMISVRPFHADPPIGRPAPGVGGPMMGGGGMGPGPMGGGMGGPPRPMDGGGMGGPPPGPGGFADRPPRPMGGGGMGPGGAAPDRTLYVGNLPYDATQEEIDTLMKNAGAEAPARVYLPLDQDGRKRGFGFVTMGSAEAAVAALEALKGADLRGRRLIINIAHPKGERPAGGPGPGPGGPGGFTGGPPRTFGGPPGGGGGGGTPGGFGPPSPPGGRTAKGDGRKRKFDEGPREGAGGAAAGKKREKEERWRDTDDDDW